MRIEPFSFDITFSGDWAAQFDRRIERRLSSLAGYFSNSQDYETLRAAGDPVVYEVYEMQRPEHSGELLHGLSIVHPGVVGDEFFMTKGHYHAVRQTAEIYVGVRGHGLLLMENERNDCVVEEFRPGRVVYVAPGWAHRSINLGTVEPLVTFFAYPGNAGHDYEAIQIRGFRKLVVRNGRSYRMMDNPAWTTAETPVRG